MDDLDRNAQAWLDEFRRGDAFTAQQQEAVRRRLSKSLRKPAPRWVEELSSSHRVSGPRRHAWLLGLAAVLVAGAIPLGWRVAAERHAYPREQAVHDLVPPAPRVLATPKASAPAAPAGPEPHAVDASSTSPGGTALPASRRPEARPRHSSSNAMPTKESERERPSAATPTEGRGLAAELEQVRRIDEALRDGEVDAAEALLATYARQFPRGQLRAEVESLHLLARCSRGDPISAHSIAVHVQTQKDTVLRARIERACTPNTTQPQLAPSEQSRRDETP